MARALRAFEGGARCERWPGCSSGSALHGSRDHGSLRSPPSGIHPRRGRLASAARASVIASSRSGPSSASKRARPETSSMHHPAISASRPVAARYSRVLRPLPLRAAGGAALRPRCTNASSSARSSGRIRSSNRACASARTMRDFMESRRSVEKSPRRARRNLTSRSNSTSPSQASVRTERWRRSIMRRMLPPRQSRYPFRDDRCNQFPIRARYSAVAWGILHG